MVLVRSKNITWQLENSPKENIISFSINVLNVCGKICSSYVSFFLWFELVVILKWTQISVYWKAGSCFVSRGTEQLINGYKDINIYGPHWTQCVCVWNDFNVLKNVSTGIVQANAKVLTRPICSKIRNPKYTMVKFHVWSGRSQALKADTRVKKK